MPNADVEIAKTVQPAGQVRPGRALTYTLTFTNHGPEIAPGVVVTDILPPELVSATVVYSSPEVISQHPGLTFAWSVADLAARRRRRDPGPRRGRSRAAARHRRGQRGGNRRRPARLLCRGTTSSR